jgi:hypothetical protein
MQENESRQRRLQPPASCLLPSAMGAETLSYAVTHPRSFCSGYEEKLMESILADCIS